ncbi:MAG: protein kinase [Desulfobacterales bacterium]|nr:protein kinase [Desulfobacterales bacterium]
MKYGRYQIVEELGRGTMGVVYKAHDPHIDRAVALKIMRGDRAVSDEFVQRFLTEAKAIGRLSHPGIVTIHDIGRDNDAIYIAEEFLEGELLYTVTREKRMGPDNVADIGVQLAEAMDYAHGKGIIHRDIKPSNIIVGPDGRVKIMDFGIARIEDPDKVRLTQAGMILGTPAYMSPEQVAGAPLDGRSDLYSLGVILYELAAGERPSKGGDLAEIFKSILSDAPEAPKKIDPSIPASLSTVIMKCLEKSPEDRFQTCGEMADALRGRISLDEPGEGRGAARETPGKAGREKRSGPVRFLIIVLLAACMAGGGVFYYLQSGKDKEWTAPEVDYIPYVEEIESSNTTVVEGVLKLESTPTGAEVYLNDALEEETPYDVTLYLGKTYKIRLKKENHFDVETTYVMKYEAVKLTFKMEPYDTDSN